MGLDRQEHSKTRPSNFWELRTEASNEFFKVKGEIGEKEGKLSEDFRNECEEYKQYLDSIGPLSIRTAFTTEMYRSTKDNAKIADLKRRHGEYQAKLRKLSSQVKEYRRTRYTGNA